MGQEYGASTPFHYFAEHDAVLNRMVRLGRTDFLHQFPNIACAQGASLLAPPSQRATFDACKLQPAERAANTHWLALHRDLLRLRREDAVFAAQDKDRLAGAVLGPEAFLLRWLTPDGQDRLVLVNLGTSLTLRPASEPLLAPPALSQWECLWSSEDPQYGGNGTPDLGMDATPVLPAHALMVLAPAPMTTEARHGSRT